MQTPRNNISVNTAAKSPDCQENIDALYEICDAEITSDSGFYDAGMQILRSTDNPKRVIKELAQLFQPYVEEVSKRLEMSEEYVHSSGCLESVSSKLAQDWNNTVGRDYRNSQAQSPTI